MERGRFEGLGYVVLKWIADINSYFKHLLEVMNSVILRFFFKKFESIFTGGAKFSNGEERIFDPILNEICEHKDMKGNADWSGTYMSLPRLLFQQKR